MSYTVTVTVTRLIDSFGVTTLRSCHSTSFIDEAWDHVAAVFHDITYNSYNSGDPSNQARYAEGYMRALADRDLTGVFTIKADYGVTLDISISES